MNRVRRKFIISKAEEALALVYQPKPPIDVLKIADKNNISVVIDKSAPEDISGFITTNNKTTVIGINGEHDKKRQRFTIAHELGHFLLGHINSEETHVDKKIVIRFRNNSSSSGELVEEVEANLFAAELLMPTEMIYKKIATNKAFELEDLSERIASLAKEFNVSEQAMMIRLTNLGILNL